MLPTSKLDRSGSQLFPRTLADHNLSCNRKRTDILQLNLGKLCNLTCVHCHVNAGPKRREIITLETVDRILGWLSKTDINTVDLTGGAPEMVPDFRYLVEQLRKMPQVETIIDRCNLTILLEPGYEWLGDFLVAHHVKIVASMPCYRLDNVDAQRGNVVFDSSTRALQLLNRLGYGRINGLSLDLVYNPNGDFLPPPAAQFLWRFHNVHHIDPDLDVSTAFRFHFGEIGLSTLFSLLQVSLIGPFPQTARLLAPPRRHASRAGKLTVE